MIAARARTDDILNALVVHGAYYGAYYQAPDRREGRWCVEARTRAPCGNPLIAPLLPSVGADEH